MGVGSRVTGARRAVFLDRDGVLNHPVIRDGKPYPPGSVAEMRMVEGAAAALASLKAAGFLLLVATNQPDVARGTQTLTAVQAMNKVMGEALPVDEFLVCAHDDGDHCTCRKPLPGLLLEAQARYGIDLARSFMIGDRWRDIDAGHAAGCCTILLDYGYQERGPLSAPDASFSSLPEAVNWIMDRK